MFDSNFTKIFPEGVDLCSKISQPGQTRILRVAQKQALNCFSLKQINIL